MSPKGEVILAGSDKDHRTILEERISVTDYYDSLHPILDDDADFRRKRGIRFVSGTIYNYDGKIDQEFTNFYGEDGAYIRSQIRFADATVLES